MKAELLRYPTEEDWLLCKQAALVTVGKETVTPPTDEFKRKILTARHSPIRTLMFMFRFTDVPYWVSVHLCRHVHAQPFVRSQRNDRQSDYDRNAARQDAPVTMMWWVSAEELMTIANKRLCNKASPETREAVSMMCDEVIRVCPEFEGLLVPACEYNGRCHEMQPCGRREAWSPGLTVAEMREKIEEYCINHGACEGCPLLPYGYCYGKYDDDAIRRNYKILTKYCLRETEDVK